MNEKVPRIVGLDPSVNTRVGAGRLGARAVNAVDDSAVLERAADLGRRGLYTPRVDRVLPLASIREAHEVAESGAGKVVATLT